MTGVDIPGTYLIDHPRFESWFASLTNPTQRGIAYFTADAVYHGNRRWFVEIGNPDMIVGKYRTLREALAVAHVGKARQTRSPRLDETEVVTLADTAAAYARQAAIDREVEINREARRLAQRIAATR